jgi:hypothetical protein
LRKRKLENTLAALRKAWDRRARENAPHRVATSQSEWGDEDFSRSAERMVADFTLNDMGNTRQRRGPNPCGYSEIACGARASRSVETARRRHQAFPRRARPPTRTGSSVRGPVQTGRRRLDDRAPRVVRPHGQNLPRLVAASRRRPYGEQSTGFGLIVSPEGPASRRSNRA